LDQTRSPGENPLPAPAAITVPTRSRPVTNGNGISVGQRPDRMSVSTGLITATSTATSTSVGPGTGTGSSPTSIASAGPGSLKKAARIVALLVISWTVDISLLGVDMKHSGGYRCSQQGLGCRCGSPSGSGHFWRTASISRLTDTLPPTATPPPSIGTCEKVTDGGWW
jgi:hypothetical protein